MAGRGSENTLQSLGSNGNDRWRDPLKGQYDRHDTTADLHFGPEFRAGAGAADTGVIARFVRRITQIWIDPVK